MRLRSEYALQALNEADLLADPFAQFGRWLGEAMAAQISEPNAMTLATASREGRPSARVVLLRGLDERGFVFFSNYSSRKGHELTDNPYAAVTFFWPELQRQVRAEGSVERVSDQESDDYFRERPRGSQLGAWASAQSSVLANRAELEQRVNEIAEQFAGRDIPRPPFWGGFRLVPARVEFWQGRPSRLHDRLRYVRDVSAAWVIERLSP